MIWYCDALTIIIYYKYIMADVQSIPISWGPALPENILSMTPTHSIMYMHLISDSQFRMNYHMHDRFEIYFVVSGTVDFFVERSIYTVEPGDLLVINSLEIHKSVWHSSADYERIILEFDPRVLAPFCNSDFNLLGCFTQRPKGRAEPGQPGRGAD